MDKNDIRDGTVICQTAQQDVLRGSLLTLGTRSASFELYDPTPALRVSEKLADFEIHLRNQVVYRGRALVRGLVNCGASTVCEVAVQEGGFDSVFFAAAVGGDNLPGHLAQMVRDWGKTSRVRDDFKTTVANIQTFLFDLRRWTENLAIGFNPAIAPTNPVSEEACVTTLSAPVITTLNTLFEGYEHICRDLQQQHTPEDILAHRDYVQRQLHPIVLCAPFAYRAYRKPLGYAGDYEMVNMMLRNQAEGDSLFARLFNVWLLAQDSAAAHRNRVALLTDLIRQEAARALREQRRLRVLNIGCGPAGELQQFLSDGPMADVADLTLLDFNEETLTYVREVLEQLKSRHGRSTPLATRKRTVHQLIKEAARIDPHAKPAQYELIYCTGLFDYISDRTCKQLMDLFWHWTAPGGMIVTTNVTPNSPNRGSLDLILDWNLIYRDPGHFAGFKPTPAPLDAARVFCDHTGVNVFMHVRKPDES